MITVIWFEFIPQKEEAKPHEIQIRDKRQERGGFDNPTQFANDFYQKITTMV